MSRDESENATATRGGWSYWANNVLWMILLGLVVAGGFFFWRYVHTAPEVHRAEQCERTCHLLDAEYRGVTDYGCACAESGIPFLIGHQEPWGDSE